MNTLGSSQCPVAARIVTPERRETSASSSTSRPRSNGVASTIVVRPAVARGAAGRRRPLDERLGPPASAAAPRVTPAAPHTTCSWTRTWPRSAAATGAGHGRDAADAIGVLLRVVGGSIDEIRYSKSPTRRPPVARASASLAIVAPAHVAARPPGGRRMTPEPAAAPPAGSVPVRRPGRVPRRRRRLRPGRGPGVRRARRRASSSRTSTRPRSRRPSTRSAPRAARPRAWPPTPATRTPSRRAFDGPRCALRPGRRRAQRRAAATRGSGGRSTWTSPPGTRSCAST